MKFLIQAILHQYLVGVFWKTASSGMVDGGADGPGSRFWAGQYTGGINNLDSYAVSPRIASTFQTEQKS